MQVKRNRKKMVGLIPAAGKAERISPLPCSKEIYPVGFDTLPESEILRPKVVSQYLIESMQWINVRKVYVIIRKGKWDILNYLGNGNWMDMNFAYLIMDLPFGVPFTLDKAYNFVKDDIVVFGFPDIIFKPKDAFVQLLVKQASDNADVVIGLFRAPEPFTEQHMVEINPEGRVYGFQIKPSQTILRYTWIIAVWNQRFTHFLHESVLSEAENKMKRTIHKENSDSEEISLTHLFDIALRKGFRIDSVTFKDGYFLDIGTPENLKRSAQNITGLTDFKENK